jgi:hypothetical protein
MNSLKDSGIASPMMPRSPSSDTDLSRSAYSSHSDDYFSFTVACNHDNNVFTFEITGGNFESLKSKIEDLYPGKKFAMKFKVISGNVGICSNDLW